jgi:hypothetical protein
MPSPNVHVPRGFSQDFVGEEKASRRARGVGCKARTGRNGIFDSQLQPSTGPRELWSKRKSVTLVARVGGQIAE